MGPPARGCPPRPKTLEEEKMNEQIFHLQLNREAQENEFEETKEGP